MTIPEWPVKPRYGDAWKNLKQAMFEAAIYELAKEFAKMRFLLTLASHGSMSTVFGQTATSGWYQIQPRVTLWQVSMPIARKMLSRTISKTICEDNNNDRKLGY